VLSTLLRPIEIDRARMYVDVHDPRVLRVLRVAMGEAQAGISVALGHAERRLQIERMKLGAMLEEYSSLLFAYARLRKLEVAGCTIKSLTNAQSVPSCSDDTTRALIEFGDATLLAKHAA